jgi:hypothetical protein
MATLASPTIIGRPFALWPATLQVMPEGILDAGFGRFFVGVRIKNGSAAAWPAVEVRISARGRRMLAAAAISVADSLSVAEGAALAQTGTGDWVAIPALPAGAFQAVYFRIDVSLAPAGAHPLELELRDPTVPATRLRVQAMLPVARTTFHCAERLFTSACDRGALFASLTELSLDQELFRSALARVRAAAPVSSPGARTAAETRRLRDRWQALLCGEETDVCSVLDDLSTSCPLPTPAPGGPQPATGLAAFAVYSDLHSKVDLRTEVDGGDVGANQLVDLEADSMVDGDVVSGTDTQLDPRAWVVGNIRAAGVVRLTPGAAAAGVIKQKAPFSAISLPTKTVSPGTTNVTVSANTSKTVAPGAYGTLLFQQGSTVTLSTGTYQAAKLTVEANVVIILNEAAGAVDLRLRDDLQFGNGVTIRQGTSAPGVLSQIYSNQTTDVNIGTDCPLLRAAFSVPKGNIKLHARSNVVGSLVGSTVIVDPDCTITRFPVDQWLGTGQSGLELLGYPIGLEYTVAYKDGYLGTTGPLAFGAVPWKALLANAVLLHDLALPGAVKTDLGNLADRAVVGTVRAAVLNATATAPVTPPPPTQAGSVDAAAVDVRTERALGFPLFSYLDAATGEPNAAPIAALDGTIATSGLFLTNTEVSAILASAASDPDGLKVWKSGAGTGVTRGILSALLPVVARDDENGTLYFVNQLVIVPDPAAPPAGGQLARRGDSGSLWVQTRSGKILAMTHGLGSGGVLASRIQDVVNALQIQIG